MNLVEHFRRWFAGRRPEMAGEDLRRLRAEFAARYSCFRDLLSANRKALEAMAELELTRDSGDEFSMALLRRLSATLMVSVLRMIKNLAVLAPDRYPGLELSFESLKKRMALALGPTTPQMEGPLVLPLERVGNDGRTLAGPKMASLGCLASELGLPTPPGLVITTIAYHLLLEHNNLADEIARRLQLADLEETEGLFAACSEIQALFLRAEIPEELAGEVKRGLGRLPRGGSGPLRLAVRSSAWGEDAPGASFAGQFASELNVDPRNWGEAYLQVVASLYSPQAVAYRLRSGLRDQDAAMAVGCLAMVDAAAGGVAYTADPMNPGREKIFVNSCWGLPKAVVDGTWDCDQFELEPGPPLLLTGRNIVLKQRSYRCDALEGVLPEKNSPQKAQAPSLSDAQVMELAGMALESARHFGQPQDVEWALDRNGRFFILQCRPLPMARQASVPLAPERPSRILLRGGVTASPGQAAGPVRWVLTGADAVAFQRGEVLAMEQPLPRWAPLLGRACAAVSVRGGLAGHLASVAREFGLPALLGLGANLRSLAQGQQVTVDASGRVVYQGRVAVTQSRADLAPQPESPLRRTLAKVLRLSAPLNLLDPESPDFTPQACLTLHDLTRFCHQKAVEEMFSRAAREHFPRNAARRLYFKVPMQWWILDLDNGVKKGAKGKYLHLEDIVCAPFHAFWEGLTEVPWDGPPALDAGGMASVMFEATANPDLVGAARGRLAERNYFLLTRQFMNLQSRMGFHFSSLEASAAGRPQENFVSFCFRGGAADQGRRRVRLAFLEEFLARLGMETAIEGDALLARAEGKTDGEILAMVKALGYLTMHTRQLDMIMANDQRIDYYRKKLESDLGSLSPPANIGDDTATDPVEV